MVSYDSWALYPGESKTKQVRSLDGVWNSHPQDAKIRATERWFVLPRLPEPTIPMSAPSSYNTITQDVSIYRCFGLV